MVVRHIFFQIFCLDFRHFCVMSEIRPDSTHVMCLKAEPIKFSDKFRFQIFLDQLCCKIQFQAAIISIFRSSPDKKSSSSRDKHSSSSGRDRDRDRDRHRDSGKHSSHSGHSDKRKREGSSSSSKHHKSPKKSRR